MDARRQRGVEIATTAKILKNRLGWKVPSQTGQGSYVVSMDGEPFCSCLDFEKRGLRSSHGPATEFLAIDPCEIPTT